MSTTRRYLVGLPFAALAIAESFRLLGELVSDFAMVVGFGALVLLRLIGRD